MNVTFDKCADALEYAIKTKTYGMFHSTINNANQNIHTHECCEIFLCIKGGNNFLIDGKLYDANNGDLFYMNQFEAHKITFMPGNDVERFILQVHPEFMLNFSTEITNLSACFYRKNKYNKIELDKENLLFFKNIFAELEKENDFADDIIKQSLVILLLAKINRLSTGCGSNTFVHTDKSLTLAMRYIDEHFREDILLDDIAKNSFISVTQLCRLFKNNLGTTASKYITSKRISEAKKCCAKAAAYPKPHTSAALTTIQILYALFHPMSGYLPGNTEKHLNRKNYNGL